MSDTVVDEKTEDQTDASGTQDAQEDDLDSILAEWDEEPKSDPEPDVSAKGLKESLKRIQEQQAQADKERTQRDIADAVKTIRTEMGDHALSEKAVRRMLNGAAGEDARLQTAWMNRIQNPDGYSRVLKALAKEFASEVAEMPDKGVTEDRESVAAAVRGASTKVPDEPEIPSNVATMSDQEFEGWVRSQRK